MMLLVTGFKSLVLFLCVALGVGFYTLMERKVLSYIQCRKGPNKVGIAGVPQPLADAVKLFTNENPKISSVNKILYILSPMLAVMVMLILWLVYPSSFGILCIKLGVLFFFAVSSLNVYCILLSGWSSNSKYSLLGAIRAVAQTISYEVSMALVILSVIMICFSFGFEDISNYQTLWFIFPLLVIFFMWFITSLAETNRAPFDLAEGESELVSGFNIEYGSGEFALLFIAEYGSILLMSFITSLFFLKGLLVSVNFFFVLKVLMVSFLFLWVRGSYPRMRYDVLMSLTWKTFLMVLISGVIFLLTFGYYF